MMALFSWLYSLLLFFLLHSPLNSLASLPSPSIPFYSPLCHPHETSALLQFKNSFSIINDSSDCAEYYRIANPNSSASWDVSRDCCKWSGVTCDDVTGHVIRLDLACSGLEGILHSNSSLFFLSHLQALILSDNDFSGSKISPQFGRFSNMLHLDLSDSSFTGRVPLELSYLSKLVTLNLSRNSYLEPETPSLKRIIANLTNLRELFLSEVNMSYVLPNSFINLSTSLTSLDLSYSELKGEFPKNVFNLLNLQVLDLSYNINLSASFPQYNWSSPLKVLGLSGSGIIIDLPYLTRKLKYLNVLSLSYCNFINSSFFKLLGNLTQITSLDLSYNNFGGEIQWSVFLNLQQLNDLVLSGNNFIGQIPEICSNSTKTLSMCVSSEHQLVGPLPLNLKYLSLFNNKLNGPIPSWLYSLPSLHYLDLGSNQFSGHLHDFQYNSLVHLDLENNKLQGLFPRSIFHQVNLLYLYISSNNLSGIVQLDQFSKLKNLVVLDLSYNSLSLHSINHTNCTFPSTLTSLYLSSCGISEFPYSLRSTKYLVNLDLSNNQIGGSIPQWLWNVGNDSLYYLNISHNFLMHMDQIPWKNLQYIDLHCNQIQGHLPIPPPSTSFFLISNNKLGGEISSLICNLSQLKVLDLSNNNLSGNIPPCIGNLSVLSVLNLRMNKLHGIIPPAFSNRNSMTNLNLNRNQLEGSLPKSLLNCKYLEILDLGNNMINGSFPHWLESLPELQILILRSNRFHGPIPNPKVRSPFKKLRIMDISNNEFMGLLPAKYFENFVGMMDLHSSYLKYMGVLVGSSYYQDSVMVVIKGFYFELVKIQTMLITIDFSRNNFTGGIPKLIGKLNSLKGLNFSYNKLTGKIPASLGNLSNLEWLDFSSNELVGKIPRQLAANLNQLGFLNLSMNKLEGPIPQGPQFNTFKDDSYKGNSGLCGFPVSKSCSEDPTHQSSSPSSQEEGNEEHMDGFDWKVVLMGYGSGIVIGISVGYMVLKDRTIDWLIENVREQWGPLVKRSKQKARRNGGIQRRN